MESSEIGDQVNTSLDPAPVAQSPTHHKLISKPIAWLTIICLMLIVGLSVVYVLFHSSQTVTYSSPQSTSSAAPSTKIEIKKLNDLQLVQGEYNSDPTDPEIEYWQVGDITSGDYKGYHRIIAIDTGTVVGAIISNTFATKDFHQFILNGNPQDAKAYPKTDDHNPYYNILSTNVTAVATLPEELPSKIKLNDQFSLSRQDIYIDTLATKNGPAGGSTSYQTQVITDFTQYKSLPLKGYTVYYKPIAPTANTDSLTEPAKTDYAILDQYREAELSVIILSSQGFGYSYGIDLPASKSASDKFEYFAPGDISATTSLYQNYGTPFLPACGQSHGPIVLKNISTADLALVGAAPDGMPLYTPQATDFPLNKLQYDKKIAVYQLDNAKDTLNFFLDANPDQNHLPTFEEYVSKHPVILFKDFWGRWVSLGEYDYNEPGGCGKPVMYFYPTQPTPISIDFAQPIHLTTDIPSYHQGWKILAQPNGVLTDLQPQFTNCNTITARFGSEYAMSACKSNQYPYLYWAGHTITTTYPAITSGWIVSRNDLKNSLTQKLKVIGLNTHEISDMLAYWVPEMMSKNTPYYKIDFLQTADMNILVPLTISPQPDTTIRVFLDWLPLASKPSPMPLPQKLIPIQRHGFTMVEWGGLRQ